MSTGTNPVDATKSCDESIHDGDVGEDVGWSKEILFSTWLQELLDKRWKIN